MRCRTLASLSLAALCLALGAPAQRQAGDIDRSTTSASSAPEQFIASGPRLFFAARTALGSELHVSEISSTGTRLVADLWTGRNSGLPQDLTDLDGAGRVFFSAQDPVAGREPWVSDGTGAGTFRLADVKPGIDGSAPVSPFRVGNRVFFGADDGVHGTELWVTDGTVAGTYRVLDLNPGAGSGFVRGGGAFGSSAVFAGDDGSRGSEPWIADGAPNSAALLADTVPGPQGASIYGFGQVGAELVFVSYVSRQGARIWATGGTPATTRQVFDITPIDDDTIGWPTAAHGLWYGATFQDVWVSDGTAANTRRLMPGVTMRNAAYFVPTPQGVFFTALSTNTGRELWFTDGTDAGTRLVRDVRLGSQSGVRNAPVPLGQGVVFNGDDGRSGREPWFSDGTAAGTRLLRDVVVGVGRSDPLHLAPWPAHGRVAFGALDLQFGNEPWTTDGTALGTRLLNDVWGRRGVGSSVGTMVELEGDVYFFASDPGAGSELWRGSSSGGVTRLEDLWPGSNGSQGRMLGAWRDAVYFSARTPSGWRLYRTDGTVGGATVLASLQTSFEAVPLGDRLYFSAAPDGNANDRELYCTDGTAAGTGLVVDLNPSRGGVPQNMQRLGDQLVFVANDGTTGLELFVSDGTAAGTGLLADLNPGSGSTSFLGFQVVGDRLFFSTLSNGLGRELFVTDGTPAGTGLVLDINPGAASSSPGNFAAWRGALWFAATDASNDRELWRSDGTPAGTRRAVNVRPGTRPSNPAFLTPTADGLFFVATDGGGQELWRTDGSQAGTSRVRNIRPGPDGSSVLGLTAVGEGTSLVFSADSGDGADEELWTSDGTFAGTRRVGNLNPQGDARPRGFVVAGRDVWFLATTEAAGEEPWVMDGVVVGSSLAEPFGIGCPGSNGEPSLVAVGAPRLGELGFAVEIGRGLPGSFAVLLLGSAAAQVPLAGGCALRVGGGLQVVLAPTDARGLASIPLPVPNVPALAGLDLFLQGATADPGGPIPGGTALTGGLRLLLGRN